jgi:hypothetical protein
LKPDTVAWLGRDALRLAAGGMRHGAASAAASSQALPRYAGDAAAQRAWAEALRSAVATRTPAPTLWRVGDALLRYWLVTPPRGTASLTELRALVRHRFEALFQGPADGWQIAADWQADRPMLCCAMPAPVLAAIVAAAPATRAPRVEAAGIHALARHARALHRDAAWCVLADDDSLLVLHRQAGVLQRLRHWSGVVPQTAGPRCADELLGRLETQARLWKVDAPRAVELIAPGAWRDAPASIERPQGHVLLHRSADAAGALQGAPS